MRSPTSTMQNALKETIRYGGVLLIHSHGWIHENSMRSETYSISTIQGLVDRGLMEYSDWKNGTDGRTWPVLAEVTEQGRLWALKPKKNE